MVGHAPVGICVRYIVGRFVIAAYFFFIGHIASEKKTTIRTPANVERLARGIVVCTRQDLFEMAFSAERACIYIEYIHFNP